MLARHIEDWVEQRFKLECPRMLLLPTPNMPPVYEGGGMITQVEDRKMEYVLFDPEHVKPARNFLDAWKPGGYRYTDADYFALEAIDVSGRQWAANRVLVDTSYRMDEPGVVCRGRIHVLTTEESLPDASGSSITMYLPVEIPVPANTLTRTLKTAGARILEDQWRREALQFDADDREYAIRNVASRCVVEVRSPHDRLPTGLDTRIEEVVWFLTNRYVHWNALIARNAGRASVKLRSTVRPPPVAWGPPIVEDFGGASDHAADLFLKYLHHVEPFEEARYHPISVALGQVLLAAAINVEAEALALGASVEAVLKEEFDDLFTESDDTEREVEAAKKIIREWNGSPRVKRRLLGAMDRVRRLSVQRALERLVESGRIRQAHADAWPRIRHPLAHGGNASLDYEDIVVLRRLTFELLELLICHAIGYSGPLVNRADPGGKPISVKDMNRHCT